MKIIVILSFFLISCNNDKPISNTQQSSDPTKIVGPTKEFKFSSATVFTIAPSFYHQPDTVLTFPDGKPAYKFVFEGVGFIDSLGRPIHNRYKKYDLTPEQIDRLKKDFLYNLCFSEQKLCMATYRDVLIFYDSLKNVLAQVPICFSCDEVLIYPRLAEICGEEPNLDFKEFEQFISDIKSK